VEERSSHRIDKETGQLLIHTASEFPEESRVEPPALGTVGIVLAGGGSKRLLSEAEPAAGGKALRTFRGQTFLERVVAAVAAGLGPKGDLIVVAAPGQTLPQIGQALVVHDAVPGSGPLAGIRDGLRAALDTAQRRNGPAPGMAVIVSCDVPLLQPEVIRLLLDQASESGAVWTVPVVHGHRQVLLSAMHPGMLPKIEAWLATGRRDLRGLFDAIVQEDPKRILEVSQAQLAAVDPALESFFDIDTPADLQRLRAM